MKKAVNINDTIVAISTPIGEAGIGIVRLSGPKSLLILDKIFKAAPRKGKPFLRPSRFKTHSIHYGWIVNRLDSSLRQDSMLQKKNKKELIIDEVLLSVMRAPSTYTREDIAEINCHSGIATLKKILDLVIRCGARMAQAGEFTRRAFLNGRIDLVQAEAVCEIVRTKSEAYLTACMNRLRGGFSRQINSLTDQLFDIIAQFQAQIDFPEEDTKRDKAALASRIKGITSNLNTCLKNTQEAKVIRDGISIAIAGRTNVGKSSLLNAFINEERCLVTPFAGTTRDAIEEQVCFDGVPLRLIDTAGLRSTRHPIEKEATRRSQEIIDDAQLVLLLFDGSCPAKKSDYTFINRLKNKKNVLAVINKTDLLAKFNEQLIKRISGRAVKISALKKTGLENLKKAILKRVWQGKITSGDFNLVLNVRQEQLLNEALGYLNMASSFLKDNKALELTVEYLKSALTSLSQLCAKATNIEDDILDSIFSQFCIGK